ncbi:MAG: hypothetical protein QW057_06225 [Candidatus Bathyarchaeia archaeon]
MSQLDQVISSENLLGLLEGLDRVLGVWGTTRKHERVAAVALSNHIASLGLMADQEHASKALSEMVVMRNIVLEQSDYKEMFSSPYRMPQKTTELDLLFLNAPSVFGHPTDGKLNFYIEVEMHGELGQAENRVRNLRRYFRDRQVELYPVIVLPERRRYDEDLKTAFLDIHDLERLVELTPPRTLRDIPGAAYDWAATSIQILHHVATQRALDADRLVSRRDGLWTQCPTLRQHDFKAFLKRGTVTQQDIEDFQFQFVPRIRTILDKMVERGLLAKNVEGKYELTTDGRDLLACYLSFGRKQG